MTVAYFLRVFPDPYEPWLYDQLGALVDRGHEVHIYALSRGSEESLGRIMTRFNLPAPAITFATGGGRFTSSLQTVGRLASLSVRRPRTALAIVRSREVGDSSLKTRMAHSLRRYWHRRSDYSVIYASPAEMAMNALPMVRATNARFVVGFQGHDLFRHPESAYRRLLRRADVALHSASDDSA